MHDDMSLQMTQELPLQNPLEPGTMGAMLKSARLQAHMTQAELAQKINTTQSTINRIEKGQQNLTLEMVRRLENAVSQKLLSFSPRTTNLAVHGGKKLSGSIRTLPSKNASVGLLCAALLNHGRTVIKDIARIEEVRRIVTVLNSIGARAEWSSDGRDVIITHTRDISTSQLDRETAQKTRSIIMFLGPLIHSITDIHIPYAGGCELGTRTVEPHLAALKSFGVSIKAHKNSYHMPAAKRQVPTRTIVLTERGDTVTENTIMAAAKIPGITKIHNASSNYMVQDLCLFLQQLGVTIDGIGTTNLTIHGIAEINADVIFSPSEDPIEAMSLLTAGIVTQSEITVKRCPIEFLEIELAILEEMGLQYEQSAGYLAWNGHTRLVDITIHPSTLKAPADKIHPMPFPGLNIDNLPFFAAICACATGSSIVYDWVYDNRAIYLVELNRLGARIRLADIHRVIIDGETHWRRAEIMCPPALRPAVVVLLCMLAAPGMSVLRNVDIIHRGYEDLAMRLKELGAKIEIFEEYL